jgi:hypothetical protein
MGGQHDRRGGIVHWGKVRVARAQEHHIGSLAGSERAGSVGCARSVRGERDAHLREQVAR